MGGIDQLRAQLVKQSEDIATLEGMNYKQAKALKQVRGELDMLRVNVVTHWGRRIEELEGKTVEGGE